MPGYAPTLRGRARSATASIRPVQEMVIFDVLVSSSVNVLHMRVVAIED